MADFPLYGNDSDRKRGYDEFSASEYATVQGTGYATSRAEMTSMTPLQGDTGHRPGPQIPQERGWWAEIDTATNRPAPHDEIVCFGMVRNSAIEMWLNRIDVF